MATKFVTEFIHTKDVKPGDRLVEMFGVMTVRDITRNGTEWITWHWVEPQPPITTHTSNDAELVIGERCLAKPGGEQCCLFLGHDGGHKWGRGD